MNDRLKVVIKLSIEATSKFGTMIKEKSPFNNILINCFTVQLSKYKTHY